ncbi:MAG: hypothetical protein ACLPSH_14420 [Vulcanimicrobiaceae bacterium]
MTATSIAPNASAEEIAAISVALEALLVRDDEAPLERAPASRWRTAARMVVNGYDTARNYRPSRLPN